MKRLKKHWRWILVATLAEGVLFVVSQRIFAASNVTISAREDLASLDGSAHDADGSRNGIFTVGGNLTLARGGAITCDSSGSSAPAEPCPIRIAVGGNLEMKSGSAILAENGVMDGSPIEIAVAGVFRMRGPQGAASGALISASNRNNGSGGNISVFVAGRIWTEEGSRITADAGAEAGDITITGQSTEIRGTVSSRATTSEGRKGAISIVSTSDETAGKTEPNASPSGRRRGSFFVATAFPVDLPDGGGNSSGRARRETPDCGRRARR